MASFHGANQPDPNFPQRMAELGILEVNYDDFEFVGPIADGGFGVVYKYRHRVDRNRYVAMKFFGFKGLPEWRWIEKEILKDAEYNVFNCTAKLLGYCYDTPEGLLLREAGRTKKYKNAYLVKISECLKRDLIDSVTSDSIKFSEQKASTAFRHLVKGLKELHDSGEVHRDLKLDNLMFTHALSNAQATEKSRISSGHRVDDPFLVKIIDTGAAETLPTGSNYIRCGILYGTEGYFAPESLGSHGWGDRSRSKDERYLHGKASDIWQAGVALYMLLYQRHPSYRCGGVERTFAVEAAAPRDHTNAPRFVGYSPELLVFPTHDVVRLSEDGKNLFRRIFVLDPEDRITCEDVLTHDWITLFASLSDDDFGPAYRRRAKKLVLRRQLRASIERSIHTCKERKSRLLPLTGPIKISNTKFRELQRAFLEYARSYAVTGINQETYTTILEKSGLPAFATEEAFKAVDIDGNNTVEYFEFLPVLATFREKTSIEDDELQTCRDYFQMMDLDGDGKITRDEFHSTVIQILVGHDEEDLKPEDISAMFDFMDIDDDKHIEFDEFAGWFTNMMHTIATASAPTADEEKLAKELASTFLGGGASGSDHRK